MVILVKRLLFDDLPGRAVFLLGEYCKFRVTAILKVLDFVN